MDEKQAKELGSYIRQGRESQQLSTRALAAKAGIDMAQVVRLEGGKALSPRPETLDRLAAALDVPLADVLALAGYPTTRTLPTLRPYMRAKYRNLPPEAVDEIEAFVQQLAEKHGNSGPANGEDER